MTPAFILDRLIQARQKGLATFKTPMTRKWFIEKIEQHHNVAVPDREFRSIIEGLADARHPVCTTNAGIYYALSAEEMEPAIQYLTSYARSIEQRIRSLKETQDILRKKESAMFEHPLVKALREEFGAEKISAA